MNEDNNSDIIIGKIYNMDIIKMDNVNYRIAEIITSAEFERIYQYVESEGLFPGIVYLHYTSENGCGTRVIH